MKEKRIRRCRFFHRLRLLTSITKSDAQISGGGETRQDYKDTSAFPGGSPRALSRSRSFGLPV
ncbi:hypothetical protein O5466_24345, partial [Escherichia coli]|nr:hypothetical protein [Escherichia coli]